ncbi:MAG: type II toxin-antitoxin system HicB family antitoxin [Polyangiaceae bacterium]|nr:type II toxin-antitoxin system HicB family antitoxin [Polyangiaceae bacterium]
MALRLTIDTELEDDGRWIAEIPELPGVMAYGTTRNDAVAKVEALALRVIAERETHRASAGGSLNARVRCGALRVQSEPMRVKEGRER